MGSMPKRHCGNWKTNTVHYRKPSKASRRAAATSSSNAKMAQSGTVPGQSLPGSISEVMAATSCCRRQFIQAAALMCGASTAVTILPKPGLA